MLTVSGIITPNPNIDFNLKDNEWAALISSTFQVSGINKKEGLGMGHKLIVPQRKVYLAVTKSSPRPTLERVFGITSW